MLLLVFQDRGLGLFLPSSSNFDLLLEMEPFSRHYSLNLSRLHAQVFRGRLLESVNQAIPSAQKIRVGSATRLSPALDLPRCEV